MRQYLRERSFPSKTSPPPPQPPPLSTYLPLQPIAAMANQLRALPALLLLCALLGAAGVALAASNIIVEGRVYCDTCRAGFETSATEYMDGATVMLQCRNYTNSDVVYTSKAVTQNNGTYQFVVEHDHQDETCEVSLVKSSVEDCAEIMEGRNRAPILVTHNVGIASNVRYANSLGFLKDKPLPACGQLLMQYALGVDG